MNQPPPRSQPGASSPGGSGSAGDANERAVLMRGNQLTSAELFACSRELTIAHGEDIYRLRLTAQNKLILTK